MKKSIIIICLSITYVNMWAQDLAWILQPSLTYQTVTPFSEGYSVVRKDDKYYFLDKQMRLSSDSYLYAYPVSQGLALVQETRLARRLNAHLWRFRQEEHKYIGGEYEAGGSFQNGLAAVKRDGTWGFINTIGAESILCKYQGVRSFNTNWTGVVRDNKAFIINTLGSEVSTPYSFAFGYSEGLAAMESPQGDLGYMDTLRNSVIPITQGRKYAGFFSSGLAAVSDTLPNLSYINRTGKILFSYKNGTLKGAQNGNDLTEVLINELHTFSEGLAAVRQFGKWGFINPNGMVVIPFDYDQVTRFSEGFAAVQQNGHWHYINKAGYTVKEGGKEPFLDAQPCSEQLAWVKTQAGWGLLAMGEKLEIVVTSPFRNGANGLNRTVKAHLSSHRALRDVTWTLNGQLLKSDSFTDNKFEMDVSAQLLFKSGKNILQVSARNASDTKTNECVIYCNSGYSNAIPYQAVLVANNLYQDEQWESLSNQQVALGNPIADADSLANVLYEQYQFQSIFVARNATLSQMQSILQDLTQQKDSMIRTLFFYAGHGDFDSTGRQAFMVPVDAHGRDFKTHLSASYFTRKVNSMSLQHFLTIIDACYGGSFVLDVQTEPMKGSGVKPKIVKTQEDPAAQTLLVGNTNEAHLFRSAAAPEEQLKSRQCISSGQRVEVPNASAFIATLLQVLNENTAEKLRIGTLFERVKTPVLLKGLVPQYGILPNAGSDGGDFIFLKQPNTETAKQ
jgi:Caspase domain/WG containing repeat